MTEKVDPPAEPAVPEKVDAKPIATGMTAVEVKDESGAKLRVAHASHFDSYLSDAAGQALYMFVLDVPGGSTSACLDDCAHDWPPFDIEVAYTSTDIDPAEVARFHRQDGAWQTTYKGHALYYRAAEAATREVTGDGVNQRWFVARDYLAFLSSARTFAPAGGAATDGAYLTDGFGRTLYVCLEDKPRMGSVPAVSSCDADCTAKRPIFATSATGRTTLLPSLIDPVELGQLVRDDGQQQLTYRGWPLYYYSGDIAAGSTEGHNDRAWRAIDPVSFGNGPILGGAN